MGRTMKVDVAMVEVSRAKYARLSMEVDLTKPLIAKFRMRRRIWRIEYEGIHLVCFRCGKYGHKEEDYPKSREDDTDDVEGKEDTGSQNAAPIARPEVTEEFSPWMLVQRQRHKPRPATRRENMETTNQGFIRGKPINQEILQGSRFLAIADFTGEDYEERGNPNPTEYKVD